MPDTIATFVLRDTEPLDADELVGAAVRRVIDANLPGLPAVDADGSYAGVFGPWEFLSAFFPRYLDELRGSRMISRTVEEAIEWRLDCADEPVRDYLNTDHVVVEEDFSDTQLAELFLHHRVQIIPISTGGRIRAVVPLDDFFRALGARLLSASGASAES